MIGQKTYHTLRSMGIATIQTLRVIPAEMLESLMGQNGMEIWKRANGIDNTPVISYSEQKSISTEHTFERDTTDTVMLNQLIVSMTEKLAYELRRQEKLASCLTVRIRYSDFRNERRGFMRLPPKPVFCQQATRGIFRRPLNRRRYGRKSRR